jgi:outer membrane immunogenic protein
MKRVAIFCALTALVGWGTSAKAADFVEPPAVYDWTGFYIGGDVGYAFSGNDKVGFRNEEGNIPHVGDLELNGIFGGGQVGYDWQASSAVFGIVADVQAADIQDDFKKTIINDFDRGFIKGSDNIDVWGTVRARVGWALDNVLLYATGGLAWADVDYKLDAVNNANGLAGHARNQETRAGYAVGGGIEWGINESWSVGAEYLYVNLGSYKVRGQVIDTDTGHRVGETIETTATPDFHSVRGYVNFRF